MVVMNVAAILMSDLHFSAVPPVARSAEPDWLAAQLRPINEVRRLQERHGNVPVVIAGDIFEKWYAPYSTPELINFLIDNFFQKAYGIPGQHDLPYHAYVDRHKTPFGTLIRAGVLKEIEPGKPRRIQLPHSNRELVIHGFPWRTPIEPMTEMRSSFELHLAVVHSYIWKSEFGYKNAPVDQHADAYKPKLAGYDAAVFGDNHQGFMLGSRIINCGTFLRRKTDERSYRPQVGILYDDGHIEPYYLDVSQDKWLGEESADDKTAEPRDFDTSGFLDSLEELGPDSLDFQTALEHRMDQLQVNDDVRRVIADVSPGVR